jgi:hypothetical protein
MESTNLDIQQGDDKGFPLTFRNKAGILIDITGWTVWLTVKRNLKDSDSEALIQKKVINHYDPTNGRTIILIDKFDSKKPEGKYWYDIQIKNAAGRIKTILTGRFNIKYEVTQNV